MWAQDEPRENQELGSKEGGLAPLKVKVPRRAAAAHKVSTGVASTLV